MRRKTGLGPVVALVHPHNPPICPAGERFFNGLMGDERVAGFEKQQAFILLRDQREGVRAINTTA
eukprot:3604243-Lingulodinium_polyedra.AAC.1